MTHPVQVLNLPNYILLTTLTFLTSFSYGQDTPLYPIKQDARWGVINEKGEIIVQPLYDAIGHFKQYGYAVVQKNGKTGLLNTSGQFVFQPQYDDVRIVNQDLFGILENKQWTLRNKRNKIILDGYDDLDVLSDSYVIFWRDGRCGLVYKNGEVIIPAQFERIKKVKDKPYFRVYNGKRMGIYHSSGLRILRTAYKEVKILEGDIFLIKSKYRWGGINASGQVLFQEEYSNFSTANHGYLLLYKQEKCFLYDTNHQQFIQEASYSNYIPLGSDRIVFQKFSKVGLMNNQGKILIPAAFEEIRNFSEGILRVYSNGKWGLFKSDNSPVSQMVYDYIAPLVHNVSLAKKGKRFGLFNDEGKLVVNTIYDKIEISAYKIKAYKDEQLTVYEMVGDGFEKSEDINKYGSITIKKRKRRPKKDEENYQFTQFEWFYVPEKRKWGLRNTSDGTLRLPPQYDFVEVKREHHLSVAGIRKTITEDFGGFPVRFQFHFHLIDHTFGIPTSEERFREVRFNDFALGLPSARVILENGRHGLVDKKGKIVCRGYAFIGEYNEGMAPMAMQGRLSSGKRQNTSVICPMEEYLIGSYGSYIIGDFGNIPSFIPQLSCEDCSWGYVDTLGRMMVPPDYDMAQEFQSQVGIVKRSGRWGIVDSKAEEVVPCQFSKVYRIGQESNIIHLEKSCEKFGLVDSMGELICDAIFDEIRPPANGLMAFKKDGKWGFMLPNGKAAIKAQYVKVYNFVNGYAAVFDGSKWGFIDKRGQQTLPCSYSRVGNYRDGLAWVRTSKGVGYVNVKGEWVIQPQYKKAYDFEDGIARVVIKGKTRIINQLGEFISNDQFDDLSSFDRYGLAVARNSTKNNIHYFLVNRKGERINSHNFRRIYPFNEGMAAVKKKNKFGFINAQGQIIIPPQFDRVSQFSEGLAWVKVNGSCGYVNKMGKFVVEPEFSKCKDFEDGRAIVYVNARKGGLVDKDGDYVLEPKLNRLLAFTEGKGLVKENRKFHFVRESGEIYEGYFDTAETFENGIAFVEIDGRWGMINSKGVPLISPKYKSIERIAPGINKVKVETLHGIVKPNGQYLLYPNYEYIRYMGGDVVRIEQGGKIGYMDLDGNWIWKLRG